MKYVDTAFGNLINSYLAEVDGLTEEEVEEALREHAKRWSGCVSCRYSICHPEARRFSKNIWLFRSCQVGLSQSSCGMWKGFPERREEDE